MNFRTGAYYSTLGTGSDLFWLISHKIPRKDWRQVLEAQYLFNSHENDGIEEFVQDAVAEGLILELIEVEESKSILLPEDLIRINWVAPRLLKYNDIQHLLLVDPIHDSSLKGWPNLEENEE